MLHAPEERSVGGVKELWVMAMQPGFVVYATFVVAAGMDDGLSPDPTSPTHPCHPFRASVKPPAFTSSPFCFTRFDPAATRVRMYAPPHVHTSGVDAPLNSYRATDLNERTRTND